MATRPTPLPSMNFVCTQQRESRLNRYTTKLPPIRIDIRRSETVLSPSDEHECQQIYEKLQQLQPNGVCVNLDTLRRALYPPTALSKDKNEQILSLKAYHRRLEQMPRIQTHDVPQRKVSKVNKLKSMTIDEIVDQVNKHAAINYSYYTRTK